MPKVMGRGVRLDRSGGGRQAEVDQREWWPYSSSWIARETVFKTEVTAKNKTAEEKLMGMGFEVCDVKKALAAVWKICEKGNLVQFGFLENGSFTMNRRRRRKFS